MKRRDLIKSALALAGSVCIPYPKEFADDSDMIEWMQRNGGGVITDRTLRLSRPIVLDADRAPLIIERCKIFTAGHCLFHFAHGGQLHLSDCHLDCGYDVIGQVGIQTPRGTR